MKLPKSPKPSEAADVDDGAALKSPKPLKPLLSLESFAAAELALSDDAGAALKSPNASNPPLSGLDSDGVAALSVVELKSPSPLLSAATGENGEFPLALAVFAGSAAASVEAGAALKSPNTSKLDPASSLATGENGELPDVSAGFPVVEVVSAEAEAELKSPNPLKSLLSAATGENGEFPDDFSATGADAVLSVDAEAAPKSPNESNPLLPVAAAGEGSGRTVSCQSQVEKRLPAQTTSQRWY